MWEEVVGVTDDEKRELIAEAEEFVKYGADLNSMEAERLLGELCGALEGTLTEPEWEYGIEYEVSVEQTEFIDAESREQAERWATDSPIDSSLVRRRKAGEWEVVTDDRE